MASAGSLIFELAADVSRLRTDMAKAQSEINSSLASIAKSSAATALMTGADFAMNFAKGFADKIKQAIDNADALGKLAQRIGTTTQELSALQYAGQFAGVGLDSLTTGFKGLQKALLEARNPLSDSAAAFKALGLNVSELQNMDPGKAFEEVAGAFTKYADGAEKAAVATQLFGKEGQALIPLLNGGKEGIAAARAEAEQLGLIVSTKTAQAMSDLNDDLTRVSNLTQGAAAVMATELQPAISEVVRIMKDAATEGTVWNGVLNGIVVTCKTAMSVIVGLTGTLSSFAKLATAVGTALNQPASFDGMKNAAKIVSDAWNQARDDLTRVHDAQVRIRSSSSESEKAARAEADAWKSIDSRPVVQFTKNLDDNAKAAKKAKTEIDEYKNMLEALAAALRSAQANGDEMKLLLSDPKFQKFTASQQASLIAIKQETLNVTAANEEAKRVQDELTKAREDADKALIDQREALKDWASAQLDSIDPTREYQRSIEELQKAQEAQLVTAEQAAELHARYAQKMKDAFDDMDPMKQQLKDIQQAIEGFGKKSSDALVDFIFSTKDASVSFSEMVTSILKDIAKLLVYKNVFEPLVKSVSGDGNTGWVSSLMDLFGGGAMSGRTVAPGQFYRVNESQLRGEYFAPNVPGRILTSEQLGTGGVNVTVNVNKDTATEDTKGDEAKAIELGKRISAVVRQVIATEKRSGGLLAS
ncbi:hypothetical protein [Paraburkholderia terrae]|uniref:Bacteriophage tail tape measure C-terminal domain-containing protein n=1 Tax=Paraburkholderia terrae TaxID=311230 RepID=A0A2I8EUD1_9BURK|nr:hypothetical protein [Paraburkholderia terrae]AUT62881.1 hypothetical protein C2L65_25235 [Paraburkholderia terrae]